MPESRASIDHKVAVHLNGDIVLTPDHAAIHKKAAEIRDLHRICVYNYFENQCPVWLTAVRTHKYQGRCCFQSNKECPGQIRRREFGNIRKTFKIDHAVYRKCASSAFYLIKAANDIAGQKCEKKLERLKKHFKKDGTETKAVQRALKRSTVKTIFVTLTFPEFRTKHKLTKEIFENEIVNIYFSRFMENLRKNYGCQGYIAVREFGEKFGRVHYHLLCSIPFIDFRLLNSVWVNTISDICKPAPNALTTKKGFAVIRKPIKAVRYLCKYFSKTRGLTSDARLVFISNNILQRSRYYDDRIETLLSGYKSIEIYKTSEWSTTFRVKDENQFNRLCEKVLFPMFFPDNYP